MSDTSSLMSDHKNILVCGVGALPKTTATQVGEIGQSEDYIRKNAQAAIEATAKAGYDLDLMMISPEDIQSGVDIFESKLPLRKWDGIIVGFGIRGVPEFTHHFEKMIELCRVNCPTVPLGFTNAPTDVYDCVVRNFG